MASNLFKGLLILMLCCSTGDVSAASELVRKSQLELPKDLENYKDVRVLVLKSVPQVKIQTEEPYVILNSKGLQLSEGDQMVLKSVEPTANGIRVGTRIFAGLSITIGVEGGSIKVGKRSYRNAITVWKESDNRLTVSNTLPIEDYLRGVLPWEVDPQWSLESLRAQAIVSRTYALFRTIERRNDPYDLESSVKSQVYIGKDIEHRQTDLAIDSTRGMILTYRGKIFPAFFHSTCGGATEKVDAVWSMQSHPALSSVVCEFCQGSKHYRWTAKYSREELENIINQHGYNMHGIYKIATKDIETSGRPHYLVVYYDGGKREFRSGDFRLWLDPFRLHSTLIDSIKKDGDFFVFKGRGWGHGIGMCQYGMKKLGELGYNYAKILDFYYPDSEITETKIV